MSALEHTNSTLVRQRDEAQRVVLHLRSMITGQAHHMEHIVRSIEADPDLTGLIEEDIDESFAKEREVIRQGGLEELLRSRCLTPLHTNELAGTAVRDSYSNREHTAPEMEVKCPNLAARRFSDDKVDRNRHVSIADVADRHLRDKTDAIADIVRNISEQCAAAVEGLQMARTIDSSDDGNHISDEPELTDYRDTRSAGLLGFGNYASVNYNRSYARSACESEREYENDATLLTTRDSNVSSSSSTPELTRRCSTSLSYLSSSTLNHGVSTFDRGSYSSGDIPTRIVEDDGEGDAIQQTALCSNALPATHSRTVHHKPSALRRLTRSSSANMIV
ncbi:hypothetical protein KEM55_002802 [Ascosphaera atra]|nr:hypothetical protein KEM55_002802 [Ascosphaera atra]